METGRGKRGKRERKAGKGETKGVGRGGKGEREHRGRGSDIEKNFAKPGKGVLNEGR